jgi:predicted O-methyltransferase YrrM
VPLWHLRIRGIEMTRYRFTNDWFDSVARGMWDQLIPQIRPEKVVEIGTYEGASTCYLIEKLAREKRLEIHCVDTWEGGIEHKEGLPAPEMAAVEARFRHNVEVASEGAKDLQLVVHKGFSDVELARLLADGHAGSFDFAYVDGSHQAPDVLCDAVLAFRLLRVGGVVAFDDYLWSEALPQGLDPIRCPKPAIDAFTNLYCRKLRIISAPLYQLYVQKLAH